MRAAAIFGLGCSPKNLKPFQLDESIEWRIGMPAAAAEADMIMVFGGDGTVHRHLGQLVKLGLPVLIVPAGSGNDFARALGFKGARDSLAAWKIFFSGKRDTRSIDLGVLTPLAVAGGEPAPPIHYFCSVAGLGLSGEVSRRANLLPRWLRAHGGYALSMAPTIFRYAARPMKISIPNENGDWVSVSEQPTLLAAFANTSTYGGGMKIAPGAQMDDGLLDICVIGGIASLKLISLFPTVYLGRHVRLRGVNAFRAERLRVETETPLDVYADGEFVCQTPVELSTSPKILKVIAPRRSVLNLPHG